MVNIVCSGPGPHVPADGVLGTTDRPGADVRCSSPSCVKPVDPAVANRTDLETKAVAALATNVTFLAIASPTTAQANAQIKALTREVNGLIRLVLNRVDDTSGT